MSGVAGKLEHMFSYVDLFAGVGGFHAALGALGGECVFASEIDEAAKAVYEHNWKMEVAGDIVPLTEGQMAVPAHDVLAAGFPCQPFSKSGFQRGMDETRGTLFWNICRVLEERQPAVILLENVRNLSWTAAQGHVGDHCHDAARPRLQSVRGANGVLTA